MPVQLTGLICGEGNEATRTGLGGRSRVDCSLTPIEVAEGAAIRIKDARQRQTPAHQEEKAGVAPLQWCLPGRARSSFD